MITRQKASERYSAFYFFFTPTTSNEPMKKKKFKISRFDLRIGNYSFDLFYNKAMKRFQFSIWRRYFFTPQGKGPWKKLEDVKYKFFELKLR